MEPVVELKSKFLGFWQEVDAGTKIMSIVFGGVLIIAIFAAVYLNNKPTYGLLGRYSEPAAAKIVRELEDNSIPFELKNGGKDVYVPKGKVNYVKLLIKEKGIKTDGDQVGLEIFDRSQLGVTDFVQNVQHFRALAGELERTIVKIKGIEGVRVHIAPAEERLFEKDQNETTATVLLNLAYEGVLELTQVKGIQQLTASSIEGLKPNNVTVVDNFGNVLAMPVEDDTVEGFLNNRVTIQKTVESHYTKKVQSLLDSVLGFGNSVVRVDALLDFDKIEETEEKFDPESAVVRSETITSENSQGNTNSDKGPPGVQSNLNPGSTSQNSVSATNKQNKEVINNKYEIDRKIRYIVKSVGDIKKISVSVFLKQNVERDEDGNPKLNEQGASVPVQRSQEELTAFEEVVKNAIGFDESRGDRVTLKEMAFNKKMEGISKSAIKASTDINQVIGVMLKFGLGVFLAFIFWSVYKKSRDEYKNLEIKGNVAAEAAFGNARSGPGQATGLDPSTWVDEFPGETQKVLKNWLKESK